MITMKIKEGQDGIYKNPKDAIQFMINNNFKYEISVYDINTKDAYNKTTDIYAYIKEYNKGKPLDDQILPTNPFGYRGILGCLGVMCYSIGFGFYKDNHDHIALFTGYNDYVLDTTNESACVCPSLKAMSSLALMSTLYNN